MGIYLTPFVSASNRSLYYYLADFICRGRGRQDWFYLRPESRVSDPGGFYPDADLTFEKKQNLDLTFERKKQNPDLIFEKKKLNPDLTFQKKQDPDLTYEKQKQNPDLTFEKIQDPDLTFEKKQDPDLTFEK